MRASRLMAIVVTLQQAGPTTATALAGDLEVSVRTIYRDIAALQAAGVPLWTEPGPRGGIRLLEGWRTRLDGLTADEAASLFLAGAPAAVAQLGLGTVLVAAQAKVLATLPPELRGRAGRVRERFHLDAPGWFHRDEPLPHLATVADAVWSDRRIEMTYRRGDATVTRHLDPLGLVMKGGTWYLVARHGTAIRTYRVGRIAGCDATNEHFMRPAGFDLEAWWAASSASFDRSILRDRVRIRLAPAAQQMLPQVTDRAAAHEALKQASPPDPDGWCTVDLAVESEHVALHQLTSLGATIEVLRPRSLRAAFAAMGEAMADLNG